MVLEPMSAQHSDGMFALWSDPEVCRYSGPLVDASGVPIESPVEIRADSDRIIDFWLRAASDGAGCRWALVMIGTAEFVGAAGFNVLGTCSEYAYHLVPERWGEGLMSEATTELLGWAVSEHGCREIELFIDPANRRSSALAERHGFVRCGPESDQPLRWVRQEDQPTS
jgi:[ribosomal protein S5]-alanine N-acetyltransferase